MRIGLGRFTTEQEVDTAVDELVHHVNKLREMSPLWEMAQEGIDIKSIEWAAQSEAPVEILEERVMAYSDKLIDHYENPATSGRSTRTPRMSAPAWSARRPAATS